MRQSSEMTHLKFINDMRHILNAFESDMKKEYKGVIPDDVHYHIKTIRERISSYNSNTKSEDIAELSHYLKEYVSKMIGFFSFFNPLKPLKQKLQYVLNQKEHLPIHLLKSENQFLSLKISDLDQKNATLSKEIALYQRSVNSDVVKATRQLEEKERENNDLLESKEKLARDLNAFQQRCEVLETDNAQLIEENKKLKTTLIALKESHLKLEQACKTLSNNNQVLNNKINKLQSDFNACPIKTQDQLNEIIERITNQVQQRLEKTGVTEEPFHHQKSHEQGNQDPPCQPDSDALRTSYPSGFFK